MEIKAFAQKKTVKISACALLALLIALGLFYFMSVLISEKAQIAKTQSAGGIIEFIRVKPRSFLDEKKRKLPEKKPKKMKAPKMEMLSSALSPPKKTMLNRDMPDIKSVLKSSGPAVGGSGGAGLSAGVTPLVRIEPIYPVKAAMQGIEGYVILRFDITPAGSVSGVRVVEAQPPKIFNANSVKALRQWKYRPKIEDGKPVWQKNIKSQLDFRLE